MSDTKINNRFTEIDIVRGCAIILMIFGHTDLVFNALVYGGEGLGGVMREVTDTYSFLARFFRTPTVIMFFGISGVALGVNAYMHTQHGNKHARLLSRVLPLLILQLSLVSLAWNLLFPADTFHLYIGIFATYAGVFLVMHFLRYFSWNILGIAGVVLLLLREYFSHWVTSDGIISSFVVSYLWQPSVGTSISFYYPLLSWLAVVMIGYGLGYVYAMLRERRVSVVPYIVYFSCLCILAAIGLRLLHVGNLGFNDWASWYEFISLRKYPPSLIFVLWGFGITALYGLFALSLSRHYLGRAVALIGRHSMGLYVLHLFIIYLLSLLIPRDFGGYLVVVTTALVTIITTCACYCAALGITYWKRTR